MIAPVFQAAAFNVRSPQLAVLEKYLCEEAAEPDLTTLNEENARVIFRKIPEPHQGRLIRATRALLSSGAYPKGSPWIYADSALEREAELEITDWATLPTPKNALVIDGTTGHYFLPNFGDPAQVLGITQNNVHYLVRPFVSRGGDPYFYHPDGNRGQLLTMGGFLEQFAYDTAQYFAYTGIILPSEKAILKDDGPLVRMAIATALISGRDAGIEYERNPIAFMETKKNAREAHLLEFLLGNNTAHSENVLLSETDQVVIRDHQDSMQNLLYPPILNFDRSMGLIFPESYTSKEIQLLADLVSGKQELPLWRYLSPYRRNTFLFRARMLLQDAQFRNFY